MKWSNPHAWIYINVTGKDGKVVKWAWETGGANALYRRGWRKEDLAAGTELVIDGFFPRTDRGEAPAKGSRLGLQEFGLPFVADPAIPRHLSAFLRKHRDEPIGEGQVPDDDRPARPAAILFNGGALSPSVLRSRLVDVVGSWFANEPGGELRIAPAERRLDAPPKLVRRLATFARCDERLREHAAVGRDDVAGSGDIERLVRPCGGGGAPQIGIGGELQVAIGCQLLRAVILSAPFDVEHDLSAVRLCEQ